MAVQPAVLIDDTASETLKNGILIVKVVEVYQVLSNNRMESKDVVLAAPALPVRLSRTYHQTAECYAVSRVAKRPSIKATALMWTVVVTYTNDSSAYAHDATGKPVTDPTASVKRVEVDYVTREQPITTALFRHSTIGPFHESFDDPSDPDTINPAKAMQPPVWASTTAQGPITNSAGDVRFATTPRYYRRITVSRIVRDWDDDILDFRGNINNDVVTVKQYDGSTGGDVRATYKFNPLTLRIDDIVKQDLWLGGSLYFKQSIVMVESKETWIHSEQDSGQRQRLYAGQRKDPDGTLYTQADMDAQDPPIVAGSYGLVNIINNGVAIGDPAKLNGHGMPLPIIRDPTDAALPGNGDTIYLNYDVATISDFTPLGL